MSLPIGPTFKIAYNLMKIYATQGIVFRILKYGESSLILDIFTRAKGLRSYIVSGIRSKKSKSGNIALYQLMNQIEIVAYDNDADKLSRIKEARLYKHYSLLQSDIVRSSIGIFILEVCRNAIKEKESNPELYDFLKIYFDKLDHSDTRMRYLPHFFMLQFSGILGFYPMNNLSEMNRYFDQTDGQFILQSFSSGHIVLSESDSLLIYKLLEADSNNIELKFNAYEVSRSLDLLIEYYKEHLPGFKPIKSLEVIRTVLLG